MKHNLKKYFKNLLTKSLVALLFSILLLSCSNNQKFKTVKIGDQVWMAENLNVDKFRNGDSIPHAKIDKEWEEAGKNGQPAWCYYENNPANGKIYGKLYNWYAVTDSRGLAPEGWRIPVDEDWEKLIKQLGGDDVAGGKLKATDTTYWRSPNTVAAKGTSFTALPGGERDPGGGFYYLGESSFWWSTTEIGTDNDNAWSLRLNYGASNVYRSSTNKKDLGFAVRCLRD